MALIFDIEKFAVHDGPGIRTVVFMKGCPLHCLWCHNPESQSFEPEIFFDAARCSLCGKCAAICPRHCHILKNGKHFFERERCLHCGKCVEKCCTDALELVGKEMTVPEVMEEVLKDKVFYDNSSGGVTLSGGEPLAHFDFVKDLLENAKKAGVHTALETSGFAPWTKIQALMPSVDLWLWDVKALPEDHEKLIGVSADLSLNNLHKLDEAGGKTVLRCPLIPEVNDSNEALFHIAGLASSLKHVQQIDLEPYHPLGENKNAKLGKSDVFHSDFASKERKSNWEKVIGQHTFVKVNCN